MSTNIAWKLKHQYFWLLEGKNAKSRLNNLSKYQTETIGLFLIASAYWIIANRRLDLMQLCPKHQVNQIG